MTNPIERLMPNSITWEIVQILADGHWRNATDIIRQLDYRGMQFSTPNTVTNMICRLVRLGIVERQPKEYRLKPGATFEIGEAL